MGIGGHAHTDAGFFSILFTILIYGIKWIFGLKFPSLIFFLPTFMAIFLGFYVILLIVFLIAWGRE